jgi:hypothetical protein
MLAQARTFSPTNFPMWMEQTYWKVAFEWTRTVPPGNDPLPERWAWETGEPRRSPSGSSLMCWWQILSVQEEAAGFVMLSYLRRLLQGVSGA